MRIICHQRLPGEHTRRHIYCPIIQLILPLLQVSHQSGFRFANKNIRTRPKIIKPKTVPFETSDLVTWVTSKFTTVTTFTSLDGGQEVTLDIGKGMNEKAYNQCSLEAPAAHDFAGYIQSRCKLLFPKI
ncbi:hypothetical protein DPMN_154066 [Dreissena polymorpha]|uniref:TGFBR3/Endoglin-like N-terminal domain-containing protein n=1 Tax=Dreissena polymorpha TaxID=45954 RepID=A0A9D4J9I5_DREPO|nr:hypothetical protein DPMN_154066 [Dreissena polymorpha]